MIFSFLFSQLVGPAANSKANRPKSRGRTLAVESLETREMLSVAGLVDVGTQPSGALDDKIVYIHGGHGRVYDGNWGYQRPLLLDMIEDLGNLDQMSQFADTLWNVGATVVPLRPVGHQLNEAVLDNDDAGVSFNGAWGNGGLSTYFGDAGDVRYRFATTSATETATAVYQPNLPEVGFYPVYTWAPAGTDRATDQLYRIHHTGGATEVTVDHSRVGNGLVYLGTFHFDAGTDGFVEISNKSSEVGKVVVADMIRFGNGVGDISRNGSVSGVSRENEAGLYWVEWHVDRSQGIPDSEYRFSSNDRSAAVSFSPRYAEFMNQAGVGTLSDRVFVSYHSNAGGGGARGTLGLYNGNNDPNAATPNQLLLADLLAGQVNDDMVAQVGVFEHDWFDRSVVTLDRADIEFGEINNNRINNEFDATIIEVAFHDNQFDAQLMRDPQIRAAVARATTQGLVDYFNNVDGGVTSDIDAPPKIEGVRVETTASGEVTIGWTPGTASSFAGDAADGYVIYASTDGLGFDGGTFISGGGTTSHVLTGLDANQTYYFKVVAYNGGGHSPDSEVLAAIPSAAAKGVLIVNGFDRLDRNLVPAEVQPGGGLADRIFTRNANSFDYAIQVTEAIVSANATVALSTASNEMIADGSVTLSDYDAVFWILGEESSTDDTFDAAEQAATAAYLSQGGKLFLSGAEIGWDLDSLNNGRSFYNNSLRADYVADDAGAYTASGDVGSIFEGLNLAFDDGSVFYNVEFPDVIAPFAGSTSALSYGNGAGSAGIQYDGGISGERLVMLAFPFETLTTAEARTDVMARALEFFDIDATVPITVSLNLDNDDGPPTYTETGTWITSGDPGVGGLTQRFNLIGFAGTATWQTDLPFAGEAEVFIQYDADSNRASGAHFTVTAGANSFTTTVDQRQQDFSWVSLGTIDSDGGVISITLDAVASAGAANSLVIADAVRIDLQATPPLILGDYDSNGTVEQADHAVWTTTFGDIVPEGTAADGNSNGVVDAADYTVWRDNLGATASAASSTFVISSPAKLTAASVVNEAPSLAASTITMLSRGETLSSPALVQLGLTDDPVASRRLSRDLLAVIQPIAVSSVEATESGLTSSETPENREEIETDRDQFKTGILPKPLGKQL